MTPFEWRSETLGKSYNTDSAYGFQCWDYFDAFIRYFKLNVSTYCALTGYVCDLWRLKDKYGYAKYFDFITDPAQLRNGDWVFFDRGSASHNQSHVCMFFSPNLELGQNQGAPYVTEKATNYSDMLGAMRFKGWATISPGASDVNINGHAYALYRQTQSQKAVVLSAGLNRLQGIKELDCNANIYAKVTGANYFQMRSDTEAPYGTTYGDISAPLNDVWTETPNQDTTLYFDLDTGAYGDCTGIHIEPTHNVYSPAVVYPAQGNYQYARMVGINHVNTVSTYSFVIRFVQGDYAVGIAKQELTPKQIAADFRQYAIESISFLDGGGSAQFGRWNGTEFEYVRGTGREVPSAVAIIGTEPAQIPPQTDVNTPTGDETQKDEEPTMKDDTIEFEPIQGDSWTDPEPIAGTPILQRISALLSVKSIITLFLTAIFGMLVLNGRELPDDFVNIYTMCISFFFGYQFKKAEGGDK